MNLRLLAVLAIAQTAFVILLVITLFMARWFRPRGSAISRRQIEDLAREIFAYLAERQELEATLSHLRDAPFDAVLRAFQEVAAHVSGTRWDELTARARDLPWFQRVGRRADSRFWWRRLDAAHAFSVIAREEDEERLLRLLCDAHPAVRLGAIPALHRVTTPALVRAALDLADSGRTPVQHYVVETVSRLRNLNLASLDVRLKSSDDPHEVRALLDLAARLGLPRFLGGVLSRLQDRDLEVRIGAVRALARFPHPYVTQALTRSLQDPAWQIRAQAATALGVIGAREAARALFRVLSDHSWWVRLRAGLSLRLIGEPGLQMLEGLRPEDDRFAADMARYVLDLDGGALGEFDGGDVVGYASASPSRVA